MHPAPRRRRDRHLQQRGRARRLPRARCARRGGRRARRRGRRRQRLRGRLGRDRRAADDLPVRRGPGRPERRLRGGDQCRASRRSTSTTLDAVCVLNPDCRLRPGALARLPPACAARPGHRGAAAGEPGRLAAAVAAPHARRWAGRWPRRCIGGDRAGRLGRLGELVTDPRAYERPGPAVWATGAAMLISAAG